MPTRNFLVTSTKQPDSAERVLVPGIRLAPHAASVWRACGCRTTLLSADEASALKAGNNQFPFKFIKNPLSIGAHAVVPDLQQLLARSSSSSRRACTRDNAAYDAQGPQPPAHHRRHAGLPQPCHGREDGASCRRRSRRRPPRSSRWSRSSYRVGATTFLDVTTSRGTYETGADRPRQLDLRIPQGVRRARKRGRTPPPLRLMTHHG